ncbi:hypothetical protein CDAR_41061 [Caerostris darwini]|uniref:Uncharacterized protein n=1 Tax=Caerostris darwini TaxID=1538125 RepID=A0AAV4W2U3_9ARAC|nr:hypothetical protein CDAR_41061 [Caerostris darwini]
MAYIHIDQAHLNGNEQNIPPIYSNGQYSNDENLPQGNMPELAAAIQEIHENKQKIQEINSKIGNREISRQTLSKTSKAISKKVSENAEADDSLNQEKDHRRIPSIEVVPEDEGLEETYAENLQSHPLRMNQEDLEVHDAMDLENNEMNEPSEQRESLENVPYHRIIIHEPRSYLDQDNFKRSSHEFSDSNPSLMPQKIISKSPDTSNQKIIIPIHYHQVSEPAKERRSNILAVRPLINKKASNKIAFHDIFHGNSSSGKRDAVKIQISRIADPTKKRNLMYIRKRMLEIVLPNVPSKDNNPVQLNNAQPSSSAAEKFEPNFHPDYANKNHENEYLFDQDLEEKAKRERESLSENQNLNSNQQNGMLYRVYSQENFPRDIILSFDGSKEQKRANSQIFKIPLDFQKGILSVNQMQNLNNRLKRKASKGTSRTHPISKKKKFSSKGKKKLK